MLGGWVAVTFLGARPFELEEAEPKYRLFRAEAIALVRNRIMEVGCEGEANWLTCMLSYHHKERKAH